MGSINVRVFKRKVSPTHRYR